MHFVRLIILPIILGLVAAGLALAWQFYSGFSEIRTLILGFAIFCVFMVMMNHIQLTLQSRLMGRKLAAIFGLEDNLLRRIKEVEASYADGTTMEDMHQRIGALEEMLNTKTTSVVQKGHDEFHHHEDDNVVVLNPNKQGGEKGQKAAGSTPRVYKPTLENLLAEEAVSIRLQPVINLMSKEVMAVEAFAYLETKNGSQEVREVLKSFGDTQRCQLDLIVVKRLSAVARKLEADGQLLPMHYAFASAGIAKNDCWVKISNLLKGDAKLASNLVPEITMEQFRRLSDKEISRFLEFKEFGARPCLTDCQGVNTIVQITNQHRIPMLKLTVQELLSYTHKEGERVADMLLPKLAKSGVETIASGVEKAHQAANLIDLDIALAQGPFISPAREISTTASETPISSADTLK